MNVILLEKIRNLGALGDQVKVKPGFARNFLIPSGKAVYANKENIAKFEQRRAELEKAENQKHANALARQKTINEFGKLTLKAKAGDEGKLFGSIGTRDIADALEQAGLDVEKREIRLSEGSLRKTGEYEIVVELESDVTATIMLEIVQN